jgi:isopenicillin N synthase-like dioxygenase
MTKPVSQLRLLHYLANERPESACDVNMGAHTDYECFTILHSRDPALQVLDLHENWVDAPPIDNTFYFNIGDMLEAWTGGLLVATAHRVSNRGNERFSMPYFQATNFDTVVSPVHCPKYADRQKDYAPVVAGEHLLSQMLRDFPYLRRRYEAGELTIPSLQPGPNPFETRIMQNM